VLLLKDKVTAEIGAWINQIAGDPKKGDQEKDADYLNG
jgi:hypothetical protein